MRYSSLSLLMILICCGSPSSKVNDQTTNLSPWRGLITDGFTGWEIRNGAATFEFENGIVTGTTVYGTPNTFLCTKQHYDDFILEFEVWVDSTINSGVQFRSNSLPEYRDGVVHGYQCEIDPSQRAWSGGIYDEQRRGWLYNLEENLEGQQAFKNGQWNQYRIEAIGPSIKTWVNEVNTANLIDSLTSSGFIALQVHAIGDSADTGKQIKWRNLRIITEGIDDHLWTDKVTTRQVETYFLEGQ